MTAICRVRYAATALALLSMEATEPLTTRCESGPLMAYGPHTDQLLANIRVLGFDPKDIKLVVITHGHRDHAGGAASLKSSLDRETRQA
jgi:glyoxylase-like metal-dependent hydrolase (beta-lactamase superfamily II)